MNTKQEFIRTSGRSANKTSGPPNCRVNDAILQLECSIRWYNKIPECFVEKAGNRKLAITCAIENILNYESSCTVKFKHR